jgi:hypothetical protein
MWAVWDQNRKEMQPTRLVALLSFVPALHLGLWAKAAHDSHIISIGFDCLL